jgi:hypothetical protein
MEISGLACRSGERPSRSVMKRRPIARSSRRNVRLDLNFGSVAATHYLT